MPEIMTLMSVDELPATAKRHADQWFNDGASGGGSFVNKLYDLCAVADTTNLIKLHAVFPVEVGAWVHRQRNNF